MDRGDLAPVRIRKCMGVPRARFSQKVNANLDCLACLGRFVGFRSNGSELMSLFVGVWQLRV